MTEALTSMADLGQIARQAFEGLQRVGHPEGLHVASAGSDQRVVSDYGTLIFYSGALESYLKQTSDAPEARNELRRFLEGQLSKSLKQTRMFGIVEGLSGSLVISGNHLSGEINQYLIGNQMIRLFGMNTPNLDFETLNQTPTMYVKLKK